MLAEKTASLRSQFFETILDRFIRVVGVHSFNVNSNTLNATGSWVDNIRDLGRWRLLESVTS
jgi:hypothetical protein